MNLILIDKKEIDSDGTYIIRDKHKLKHIIEVLKPSIGKSLKTGIINGKIGDSEVIDIELNKKTSENKKIITGIKLQVPLLQKEPPEHIPVTLIIAMQRPKTLSKILQNATSMGVKKFYIIETWKVEKGYWTSSILSSENIQKHLILGLEQAGDTIIPEVYIKRRFKPFVEDELPAISKNTISLVAHPYTTNTLPISLKSSVTLAIGPEGGFTDYEIQKFKDINFSPVNIGKRILRSEYAVTAVLAKLF